MVEVAPDIVHQIGILDDQTRKRVCSILCPVEQRSGDASGIHYGFLGVQITCSRLGQDALVTKYVQRTR